MIITTAYGLPRATTLRRWAWEIRRIANVVLFLDAWCEDVTKVWTP